MSKKSFFPHGIIYQRRFQVHNLSSKHFAHVLWVATIASETIKKQYVISGGMMCVNNSIQLMYVHILTLPKGVTYAQWNKKFRGDKIDVFQNNAFVVKFTTKCYRLKRGGVDFRHAVWKIHYNSLSPLPPLQKKINPASVPGYIFRYKHA